MDRVRYSLTLHPESNPEDAAFLELMAGISDPSRFLVRLAIDSGGPATRADLAAMEKRLLKNIRDRPAAVLPEQSKGEPEPVPIPDQEETPKKPVKKAALNLMKNW